MTAVPTLAVLRRARALVAREETWVRHSMALTSDGCLTLVESPDAGRFCLLGAVRRACFERLGTMFPHGESTLVDALHELARRRGWGHVGLANDVGGRLVALAILDDAIAELEGEGR